MKHSAFENWILDESALTESETRALKQHLAACEHCRRLKSGWEASKILLSNPRTVTPAYGFTQRWQKTLVRKCAIEKVRRYRLNMFGLFMLITLIALVYMVASGSFVQIFANSLSRFIHTIMDVTNALALLRAWITQFPSVVPLTAGFLFFGLVNAFLIVAALLFWDIRNRKRLVNETSIL